MITGPEETPYFYAAQAENHNPHLVGLFVINDGVLLRIADLGHNGALTTDNQTVEIKAEVLLNWHEFIALIGEMNNEVIPDLTIRATPDGWTVTGA